MNNDRNTKNLEWLAQHPELVAKPSMKRRKVDHDYGGRCVYLITTCTSGRAPIFGSLRDADSSHPVPWVQPSELGLRVIDSWQDIGLEQPAIERVAFQLMPDHVHGILFVTGELPRHLGHYVSRFKAKCTKAWRDMSVYSETQSRTEVLLWEKGYNDRILSGKGQLHDWINYVQDNPRRLWVKRNRPEWFTARRGIVIGSHTVTVMGNAFLLDYPYKVMVQCSRSLTEGDIVAACDQYLSLASAGAVLVSACISPGEKAVMRRAFEAGCPQIVLLENGFAPMQKPSGRQLDACAEGRLLLVAPWEHHNERRVITREQCLALNALAAEIADCETATRNTPTDE
ncbi:MAG: transposase [Muribaculaceae bacterium]|nr:transposase [Muribaculaceae bacterium]